MDNLPTDWVHKTNQFTKRYYRDVYPSIDPTNAGNSIKGKTVLVTGASRGIGGRGIVPALAKAGAKSLILLATNLEKLQAVAAGLKEINPAVEVSLFAVDLCSTDNITKAWADINVKHPKIDVLVNNAGQSGDGDVVHETPIDRFFLTFEVNVRGTHLMATEYIKAASSWATAEAPGVVINISSVAGWTQSNPPFMLGYGMARMAGIQYINSMANAYSNFLFIAINPGIVDTDIIPQGNMLRHFDFNEPALTGGVIAWLAADFERARFLNGRVFSADWDVDELLERKEEIVSNNLLTMKLNAVLGAQQFEDPKL